MNSKKKVARWVVPFAVVIFVLGLGVSHAYDTSQPPLDYKPRSMAKESLSLLSETANSDVLLIQTAIPWNSTADTDVLNALEYSFDIIDMDDVPNTDIDEYQVVLVVNDQVQAFYDNYAANYAKFENYVNDGGTLVFFACDHGWANGNNYTDLPGGVQVGDRYSPRNIVSNSDHPIIKQELVDHQGTFGYPDQPLQNADMYGNYCSHNYFVESTLPPGADVLLRTNDTDQFPTLVVYKLGNGHVIASGITWEAAYAWWNKNTIPGIWSYGRALPDVFKYAFGIAGGHKISGIRVDIYPEDSWLPKRLELYKAKGDLIDIVACITNNTEEEQGDINLTLKIDSDLIVDPNSFLYIYKRLSAEQIAIEDPVEIQPDFIGELDGNRVIIVRNLTIKKKEDQQWNDFVFRLKLKDSLKEGIKIDAEAIVSGTNIESSSEKLSDGGDIVIKSKGNVIITNRELMYKAYGRKKVNNDWSLDDNGVSQIHDLWKHLYVEAYLNDAVIYFVDKYDKDGDGDHNNSVITTNWIDDDVRTNLPYDGDETTHNEEGAINEVANLIDSMLDGRGSFDKKGFIGKLGGDKLHVLILGGDKIIPFYRVYDPTHTVYASRDHHTASVVIQEDAQENYTFSDVIYRDKDGDGWGNGGVENIYVGRIAGPTAKRIERLLLSSSVEGGDNDSSNVIKVENNMRNCELDEFDDQSNDKGYLVITTIEDNNNSTNLDVANPSGCLGLFTNLQTGIDDPARWNDDFERLFTGNASNVSDFDIIRFMCHGSVNDIANSEDANGDCEVYFNGSDLRNAATDIRNNFEDFYPVFVFDACLVGLVDDDETTVGGGYHFLNALMHLNVRGVFAASGVTYSNYPTISSYNDYFTKYCLKSGYSLGRAATMANKKGGDTILGDDQSSYHSFIMNLYGCPWATVKTPNDRNENLVEAGVIRNDALYEADVQRVASMIDSSVAGSNTKTINIECSSYNIISDTFDVLTIEGWKLLLMDESTPVLPIKTVEVNIPLNSTIEDVTVTFGNETTWSNLNIPAYQPPIPMPESGDLNPGGGYVACPSGMGVLPTEQYSYRTVDLEDFKTVMVSVFPATFDTDTHETVLYKNIAISINYTTPVLGIIREFSPDKKCYAVNGIIQTSTSVENISAIDATFTATIEIVDSSGNVVVTQSASETIQSNMTQNIILNLSAPAQHGSYTLSLCVSDATGVIGEATHLIKVIGGKIVSFIGPSEIEIGSYGKFTMEFHNFFGDQVTAFEDIYIYGLKDEQIIKLPQLVVSVGANETEATNADWFPADSLPTGRYKAQLVVSVDDLTFMAFCSLLIVDYSNQSPSAKAGPDQTVEAGSGCMGTVALDGSGSSDPDGDPLTYTWTWDGGFANGVSPTIQLPLGTTTITLVVNNGTDDSEPDTVDITVADTTSPAVAINIPNSGDALQDGITLTAEATDACEVAEVYFCVREPGGENGIIIGYEDLPGALASGEWECDFDTTQLQDGYYVVIAKATDTNGNEGWSTPVPVSIRNWAVVELLPNTASNKAGRTMPVKFALRIAAAVDPAQPFVYNEELEIRIYDASVPDTILQTSLYGGGTSTDYRIDTDGELYITNFKTSKKPAEYVVEIWRMSKNFLVGSFTFETVK